MTVAENIGLVAGYAMRRGGIDWQRRLIEGAADVLERMPGGISPDARLGSLNAAAKSIVAIARALAVRFAPSRSPRAHGGASRVARSPSPRRPSSRETGWGRSYLRDPPSRFPRVADRVMILRGRPQGGDKRGERDLAPCPRRIAHRRPGLAAAVATA